MPLIFLHLQLVLYFFSFLAALALGTSVCERLIEEGHCFLAIVHYLLNPRALSVQLYATNEMTKRGVSVLNGGCHSC